LSVPELLLTEEQRFEFTRVSPNISKQELINFYTFSSFDLEHINKHRREYNKLGFAVQVSFLHNTGWNFLRIEDISEPALNYIAEQISVNPIEIQKYFNREKTRLAHLKEIKNIYSFTNYSDEYSEEIKNYLMPFAIESDNSMPLIKLAINKIRSEKTILPGITTIEKLVSGVLNKADNQFIENINKNISLEQKEQLETLLSSKENNITKLAWLREDQGLSNPRAFIEIIDRLEYIRKLKLELSLEDLHPNRIKQFARLGSKYEPYAFRRFDEKKRYGILVLYLYELSQILIDRAVDIHDKQINLLLSKGRKEQDELQKKNGKSLNEKIVQYIDLGAALIKAKQESLDPFVVLEKIIPWDILLKSVEEAKKLARPVSYDYIDLLDHRFSQLRKYTPILVKHLKFSSTNNASKPLIEAINILKTLNETKGRKIPDNAPTEFISSRWNKCLFDEKGSINRHYYEMATLSELKNRIRSGDIAVEGSKNFKNFEEYLISKEDWFLAKNKGTNLSVSTEITEYLKERIETLSQKSIWLSKNISKLDGISIENDRLHIDKLEKETPPEAITLSQNLYRLIPKVKLSDLLLEVLRWTNFDKNFIHASNGSFLKNDEKSVLMATLMAMGTNIGLSKMADATPGISYKQMSNLAQWRLYDDAMKKAQATLVNYHHRLALPLFWGDGTTSSSDGMRVQVGVSSLLAEANPHYGSGKGVTIYRFVSDKFSSFYLNVISTNTRDALHVIDGYLYHETDLNIQEHFTDTAGYTDQIFGLTQILGFKFAPRIRDISDLKLYSFGSTSDYPKIETILKGKINTKVIVKNYDDVLRLAHSIREGIVTASLIMGKIGSYSRQNNIATALKEMGKIEKTIFILDYISDESLRRRIQRGLNKGEAMNALARAIFFGKRGEFRERELHDQLQRASALNILINAISIWNTVYLEKAIEHYAKENPFDESLLKHISPLGWEHINLLGEYRFDNNDIPKEDEFRPLNILEA